MDQQPSVGRIVHYRLAAGEPCKAAVITRVNDDDSICVTIFVPNSTVVTIATLEHESSTNPLAQAVGTWHWPERV